MQVTQKTKHSPMLIFRPHQSPRHSLPPPQTDLTHTACTQAFGRNQIRKAFICPRIVYIMEGRSCSTLFNIYQASANNSPGDCYSSITRRLDNNSCKNPCQINGKFSLEIKWSTFGIDKKMVQQVLGELSQGTLVLHHL